jgi:hypothetical protein
MKQLRSIVAVGALVSGLTAVDARATRVYWASENPAAIHRAFDDGFDVETVISTEIIGDVKDLVVDYDGGKIYFVDSVSGGSDNRIRRSNLDGSGIEDLAFFGEGVPTQIALDLGDAKLYWTLQAEVWRSNVDGTSPGLIYPNVA